ncbi:hypothetical protein QRD89_16795 [Halobacillus sp. ACCC02827]|uniref:hypothetical protein n=1 Tax=Bacillaceae TaxID=186817 RepID=UPI0002A4D8A8|nr:MULTISPECIES: hypothetical protein [Bacillaceae]ELK49080.1 hypothetical protein D479_00590 [Halobacillus sp. BAB-2008]QHT48127.1 hypothetical protein M662_17115 [Bacillus sp. SB49]WJE15361.1 hypothetical protein QRD89_16795 [Halobacillus sp. ACCC02827]
MFFFRKRTPPPTNDLKELLQELQRLRQTVEHLQEKHVEYHLHIDHVDIHDPKLEQLTFQLDNLDIKELSGALNMGNNFGVHVKKDPKPEAKPTKDGMKITFKPKED